jgi:two-component system response regulator
MTAVSKYESRPIVILLVEDNPTDVLITKEGLLSAKVLNEMHVADDGVVAMEFLRREGKFASAPRPDLVLLDLNMPRKNGQEVLAEIKSDESLWDIPVVILTTSQATDDIGTAYRHHANCFITKPVNFGDFSKVVETIHTFWFSVVTLPVSADEVQSK